MAKPLREIVPLNELSKKTLGSYVKKAIPSLKKSAEYSGEKTGWQRSQDAGSGPWDPNPKNPEGEWHQRTMSTRTLKTWDKHDRKIGNRETGIKRASAKIASKDRKPTTQRANKYIQKTTNKFIDASARHKFADMIAGSSDIQSVHSRSFPGETIYPLKNRYGQQAKKLHTGMKKAARALK